MMWQRVARWGLWPAIALAAMACTGGRATPTPMPTRPPMPTATEPIGLIPSPTPDAPAPTPLPTATIPAPVEANALNLVEMFIAAPYRVVAVAPSPYAPYTLIVVNERSPADCGSPEQPQRCTADETCGSFYTAPTCFFFVEPTFDAAADPSTRFVARWPDAPTVSALLTDSFRFVNERTVEFRAAGGDGGYSVQEVWWLDLVTGALALQSRVENTG